MTSPQIQWLGSPARRELGQVQPSQPASSGLGTLAVVVLISAAFVAGFFTAVVFAVDEERR